jgi:hypothetical protein
MAESAKQRLSYVHRLTKLADVTSKREIRRELLQMVGEVLDSTDKEAMILRGLELTARLTGACDMTIAIEPQGPIDMARFQRPVLVETPALVSAPRKGNGAGH